jgi:hypothetical protein
VARASANAACMIIENIHVLVNDADLHVKFFRTRSPLFFAKTDTPRSSRELQVQQSAGIIHNNDTLLDRVSGRIDHHRPPQTSGRDSVDELLTASSAGVPRGEGAQGGLRQAILESGGKKPNDKEPLSQMQMAAQAANCGR